jgi:hypothetical protein
MRGSWCYRLIARARVMTVSRFLGSHGGCLVLAAAITAGACGGGGSATPQHPPRSAVRSDRPTPRAKTRPTERCSVAKRQGSYQVQIHPFSSTCPELPDYVEQWDRKTPPLGEHCTFDMPDRWSSDGCTLERAFTCEQAGGGTARTVMTSTQKSDDGSILAGMLSLRKYDRSGESTCQGTYSFTSSRE